MRIYWLLPAVYHFFLVTIIFLTTVYHVLWQCLLSLTLTLAVGLLFTMNSNTCDTTHKIVIAILWYCTWFCIFVWSWASAGTNLLKGYRKFMKESCGHLTLKLCQNSQEWQHLISFLLPGMLKEVSSDTQKISQLTCKILNYNKW